MNQFSEISVVIPTSGRISFLSDALRSIEAQTVSVTQVVLVCDGVGDTVFNEIKKLTTLYSNIETIRLETKSGAAHARNAGLELARGDYLIFLDDDDLLHPEMLENAMRLFRRHPTTDIVVCKYQVIFTPAGAGNYPEVFPFNPKLMDQHPLNLAVSTNFAEKSKLETQPLSAFLRYLIPINSCVIKQSSIGDCRFPEELVQGEDTYFWISLAHQGCNFYLSQKPYACIQRHGDNTTRSRAEYIRQIPYCYKKIQDSGWLVRREDKFLVALKLFYFAWKENTPASLVLLVCLLKYPVLLARETLLFFRVTVRDRRRLLKYYFQD